MGDLATDISARFERLARHFETECERSQKFEIRRQWIDTGHPADAANLLLEMANSGLLAKLGYDAEEWLRPGIEAIKSARESGSAFAIWRMNPVNQELEKKAEALIADSMKELQAARRNLERKYEQFQRSEKGRLSGVIEIELQKEFQTLQEMEQKLAAIRNRKPGDNVSEETLRTWIAYLKLSAWWLFITTAMYPRHRIRFRWGIRLTDCLADVFRKWFFPELEEAWERYRLLTDAPFDRLPGESNDERGAERIWISAEVQATACRILAEELRALDQPVEPPNGKPDSHENHGTETAGTVPDGTGAHWDPQTERRNKWIYQQCKKGETYKVIISELAKKSNWATIGTPGGIKKAAQAYAKQKDLPSLPPRKRGRPNQK